MVKATAVLWAAIVCGVNALTIPTSRGLRLVTLAATETSGAAGSLAPTSPASAPPTDPSSSSTPPVYPSSSVLTTTTPAVSSSSVLTTTTPAVPSSSVSTATTPADPSSTSAPSSSSKPPPIREADVVIIGAGASGISAALALLNEGFTDFVIVEGRNEVGGRAQTETLVHPTTGVQTVVEKGPNWVQGYYVQDIVDLANKWNLTRQAQNMSDMLFYDGGSRTWDQQGGLNAMSALNDAISRLGDYLHYREDNVLVDMTVRAALRMVKWIPRTPLEYFAEWLGVQLVSTQSPETASLGHTFQFDEKGPELEDLVIDPRGYRIIFENELKEKLNGTLNDPHLLLNTTVRNVDYSGNNTVLTTSTGDTIVARKHVIATVSIGVLQDDFLTWTPELPDWKREAINAFYMGTYQKVHLLFDKPFWDMDHEYVGYADAHVRGRYALWQNLNAPGFIRASNDSGYILFVTSVADEALRVGSLSDADAINEITWALRDIYGVDAVPEPLDYTIPRWDQDPLFRGSYSNWPFGETSEHYWNLRQTLARNKIFFTGEAYSQNALGYVQGAWSEGKTTGKAVATCARGIACPMEPVYEEIQGCNQSLSYLRRRFV